MPDLPTRGKYEKELAAALLLAWEPGRIDALAGREPDWELMKVEIEERTKKPLSAAALAAALLMMMDLAGESKLPADFDPETNQAKTLAGGLVATRRREWRRADDPAVWVDQWLGGDVAERIAATEVTGAVSLGEERIRSIFEDLGVKMVAVWNIDPTSNVCAICRPLGGHREGVWESEFPTGPPAHVNCRCYLTYVPA